MAWWRRAVGLDFGRDAIKVVVLRARGPVVEVEKSIVLPRVEFERGGSDPAALAAAVAGRLEQQGVRVSGAVLALDGAESILRYTHVPPMPDRRLETVVSYEVLAIADRMGEPLASDFAVLPVWRDDGERTVLLGLAKETPLEARLESLEAVGIRVASCVPPPLALYSAWELFAEKAPPDDEENDVVLAIDIGAQNLHMVVILDNRLVFARSATFGGERFTESLATALGLSRADAEALKKRRGGLDPSIRGVAEQTVGPLRTAAGQLLNNLQSTLRFAASQGGVELPAVTRLWLTGGGARLSGLGEWLGRALSAKRVESFAPLASAETAETKETHREDASLGLAVGLGTLAMRTPSRQDPVVDVLPAAYRRRRTFRERTFWAWAAAAMLVLALVVRLAHGLWLSHDAASLENDLRARWSTVEARRSERDASTARAREIRARIDRLLDEAEPTAFQAFLLHFFGEALRAEIRLDSIELVADEREGGGFAYEAIVKGRVSNERRKGFDWILELQDLLTREDRVREVKFRSHEEQGPWYTFTMAVVPESERL